MWRILFLFFLIFVACGVKQGHPDKMVFRYNESAGISSLDPAFSRNLENLWACNLLYNGLVEIDDELQVQPAIAHSWEIDSSGTVYRFYLRNDVFFHESEAFENGIGRKVVANDFVYSFERVMDVKKTTPGAWVFGSVAPDIPFQALNDSTLEIRLKNSFPPFLGLLGMKYCSVIPKEAIDKYGDDFRSNPVGTGPFKFHFWIENSRLALHRNVNYWEKDESGNQLPYLDAVSVSFIPDKSAAYLDFLKGNFDFMSGLHASYKDELMTSNGELKPIYENKMYLQKHPFLKTDYLGFQVSNALNEGSVWLNSELRRAVNYAIDRDAMVRFLRNNVYTPAHGGFIPKGMAGYNPNAGYNYNPDSVRAILDRLGYSSEVRPPEITLSTTTDYVDLCEYVQHQLSEFGVSIKVDVLPASVHRENTAKGNLPFFRKSWLADYPDEENFMALFYSKNHSPKGPNYTHYQSDYFDQLYEKAITEVNPEVRADLYAEMDSLMMATAPIVPLYYDMVMRFVSKDVSGMDQNPMNVLDLRRVKINFIGSK
ncbi:MAG: ABC transporter substrate-binding protein [Flavobacteriales bacterium]|nr:ABC transporter substrate-binding protein [Flavobacteriales bacterium]